MSAILQATMLALNGLVSQGPNEDGNIVDSGQGSIPMTTENQASSGINPGGDGILAVASKSTGYLSAFDQPQGSALNPIAQLGLFTKVRQEHDWLEMTSFAPVSEKQGFLDLWDDRQFRMHPTATEGPRKNIPLHKPDVSNTEYSAKTLSGAFGLRLTAIRAAAKAGKNVNALVQAGVAAGIGNVLADIGINGNAALAGDTSLNKMRSTTDGWFERLRSESPNYTNDDDGFSYWNKIWSGMLHQIDKPFRKDKGLAWMMTDTLSSQWLEILTATGFPTPADTHPSVVNPLGMALLNQMGQQANPLGKPGLVIPQMEDDRFGELEGYEGIAPTTVLDNGDGTLTITLTTLTGATDRSSTGPDGQRFVTVTFNDTGVQETLAVDNAGTNTVTTESLLGQGGTGSSTASEYSIKWADMQSLFLGITRFLTLVAQHGMRIYTVFYPHDEVIEIIVHMDIDYLVVDPEATSLVDGVISPQFSVLPPA